MTKAIITTIVGTVIIVVAIIYVATRPRATNLMGNQFSELGGQHIDHGQEHAPYNSNPPSSGPHYANPAPWGFYDRELEDEQVVHNLEHGGVWVTYKPEVDQATKDAIKHFVERFSSKVIATERAKNDSTIAFVSWGRVLKTDTFNLDTALDFVRANKNHGPEQIPD